MPFPVEPKYIQAAEQSLGIQLPPRFKARLSAENGGEILLEPDNEDSSFTLLPVFDTSDKKRLRRTCNHIAKETASARESWHGFPAQRRGDCLACCDTDGIITDWVGKAT